MNCFNILKKTRWLIITTALLVASTTNAQNSCATATAVTDLTGTICATSSPGTTSTLGAGTCEEGTIDTWFQFTAQGVTATIDVSSNTSGWRPEFLIVSGTPASTCNGLTPIACFDANGNYTSLSGTATGLLTIGETYWIVVSSNGNNTTGTLTVCVDNPPPGPCQDNEDCGSPLTIALNAPGAGSACITDCNTAASAGPNFAGTICQDMLNPTVWYTITTSATTTSLDITIGNTTFSNPEFNVFTSADCSTFGFVECIEGTGNTASSLAIPVSGNTTYLIAVSDATGDVGSFDLCITQNLAPICADNEACVDAAPITLNATGSGSFCITDCNTGTSPGISSPGNCQNMPNATVWYTFTTGADAATIDIALTSAALLTPEFTLFSNTNCAALVVSTCVEGAAGSGSATATAIGVAANTTYTLAISDVAAGEGEFTLCIGQDFDNSACNVDNELTVTSTSMGSPLNGPYQPGEVVNFCYTINSFTTGFPASPTACNYIQGIVPSFGDCWAPASFNAQGMPVTITTPLSTIGVISDAAGDCGGPPPGRPPWCPCVGDPAGTWAWSPAGTVTYNLNQPNSMGNVAGDDVGAGWFFTTAYSSSTGACGAGGTNPNNSYGDNSFPSCLDLGGWQVCFSLIANNVTDCLAGEVDCNVSIKSYADGEIGVWASIGCTVDQPTVKPASLICVLLSSELEKFEGKAIKDKKNLLTWKINAQLDLDQFRIERSSDGIYWTTVGTVEAQVNTSNYSYIDVTPFSNITYYRLKIKNISGNIEGSPIIAITSSSDFGSGLISELSPNPAKNHFNFTYTGNNLNEDIHIKVVNLVGQTVINYTIPVTDINEIFEIETSSLANGIYSVDISQGQLNTVKRIQITR